MIKIDYLFCLFFVLLIYNINVCSNFLFRITRAAAKESDETL